jgi:acyl-CoA dehydrogenase
MNETQTMLHDAATRLFTDLVSKELLESAEAGAWPDALWRALEEGGLTRPLVGEARGGAGLAWEDAYVLLRAAGRFAAPVPLAETAVANWLLSAVGLDVPSGPLTLAPVRPRERLALDGAGAGGRLTGTATRVPWGGTAGHVVVVTDAPGGSQVALVAAGSARVTPDRNLALEPRDTLAFEGAPVLASAPLDPRLGADPARVRGALVRSAQLAGGLEFLLDEAVRYATERRQFGRPIGAFQAIQHQLAILAGHTAAAGAAAAHAFRAADRGDPALEVAVAKIRAGEAAGVGAAIAHQVHGAIGFTYEHRLHFVTRRLWSWRAEFGSEARWAADLGRDVAARGADALWPALTAR